MLDHDVRRALARLAAVRDNVPANKGHLDAATYVADYHSILDGIAQLGYDVADFRIPDVWAKTMTLVSNLRWRGKESDASGR